MNTECSLVLSASDSLREAIALLQCCEDASSENHIKTALGVAVGMLLGVQDDISSCAK